MSTKLIGILLVSIALMGAGFTWYYKDTQKRIEVLQQNNAQLDLAVDMQEETISGLQTEYQRATVEVNRLNTEYQTIRRQNQILVDKLSEHDIGVLSASKPGLMERIINRASDRAGRCFELLSGAELTESEENAKTANEFNSECPWLWTGSANP